MTDELTLEETKKLEEILHLLEKELVSSLDITNDSTKPVSLDEPIGRITRMDAIQQQQMAKANRESSKLRLKQVRRALREIEMGEYGECKKCGEYISLERLKARPEAPFCLHCQSASESRSK